MKNKKYIRKILTIALSAVMIVGSGAAAVSLSDMSVSAASVSSASTLQNDSYLSSSAITKGQYITIYGKADGGTGGYTYAYYYKQKNSSYWATAKAFSSSTSAVIKPAAETEYDICVKVKDSSGKLTKKYLTAKVNSAPVLTSSISASSINKGQSVTLKASASGGTGTLTYAYYYKQKSSNYWAKIKDFSSTKSVSVKPANAAEYDFCIKAKDSTGYIVREYLSLEVKNVSELVSNSTVSAEEISLGESVNLTAAGSGGVTGYTYAFYVKLESSSSWKTLRGFSSKSTFNYHPTETGKCEICIKIKDSAGTVAKTYFSVNVSEETFETKINRLLSTIITENMDEFTKVKAIHDWITENVEYDQRLFSGNMPYDSYTAEGAFENRVAVCDGYAKLFLKMAGQAGFDVERVTGTAYNGTSSSGESHAWNQIKVDGNWYNIDVTWDDPIIYGVTDNSNIQYKYFLIPDSVINTDHVADYSYHSCTAEQPTERIANLEIAKATSEDNCSYAEDAAELKKVMQSYADNGIYDFTIIYHKDSSSINSDLGSSLPANHGASFSYRQWIFDGYTLLNVQLT